MPDPGAEFVDALQRARVAPIPSAYLQNGLATEPLNDLQLAVLTATLRAVCDAATRGAIGSGCVSVDGCRAVVTATRMDPTG